MTMRAFANKRLRDRLARDERLKGYPDFYLHSLAVSGRYTLIACEGPHKGAGMGSIDGETVTLYGSRNFQQIGGLAGGKNYDQHERFPLPESKRKRTNQ